MRASDGTQQVFALTNRGIVWLNQTPGQGAKLVFPSLERGTDSERRLWRAIAALTGQTVVPVTITQEGEVVAHLIGSRTGSSAFEGRTSAQDSLVEVTGQLSRLGVDNWDAISVRRETNGQLLLSAIKLPPQLGFRPLQQKILMYRSGGSITAATGAAWNVDLVKREPRTVKDLPTRMVVQARLSGWSHRVLWPPPKGVMIYVGSLIATSVGSFAHMFLQPF